MDILRPELQWIDGICYRINPGSYNQSLDSGASLPYEYDSESWTQIEEPEMDDHYEVETLDTGRVRTSFHVAKVFFPYIIGTKGAVKKRIENETRCIVAIPKQGCEGNIVITGAARRNVCSARNRINMLVISSRKKIKPTHFLAFPLDDILIQQHFCEFKASALQCSNIPMQCFQKPERLHVTIGVLTLCDELERAQAAAALNMCLKEVVKPLVQGPISVRVRGLECLNDDLSAVNVVYAKVSCTDGSDSLQRLANATLLYFREKGLIIERLDKVLIHATLINTSYYGKSDDSQKLLTVDASKIFELYGDYDFGEGNINYIDLIARFSDKQASARISLG